VSNSSIGLPTKYNWKRLIGREYFDSSAETSPAVNIIKNLFPCNPLLYDATNIDNIAWPNTEAASFARKYLIPFIKNGTKHYISNIDAEMRLMHIGQHVVPIVIVNNNYENAYVCSPYAHYISLALDSLHLIKSKILRKVVQSSLKGLGHLLRKVRINQIVYVNHWLLSTDLYPEGITIEQTDAITKFLKLQFPEHAIAFRSINNKTNESLKNNLEKCGYNLIASRQVYITNPKNQALFQTRIVKSDLKLWNERDYQVCEHQQLTNKDIERILTLYNTVTLEHHSHLNPQLNENFVKLMMEQRILNLKALKKDNVIDGVVGYFHHDNVFMCPFFGYDKSHQDTNRLYRLLSTMLLLEAAKDKTYFHQGAGASFYKKIRRAVNHQEYLGVYCSHLSAPRRFVWRSLKAMMNTVGVIFMKKY